jgi:hypothetical protein
MNSKSISSRPLSLADWRRALPWLVLMDVLYFALYLDQPGNVSLKYCWDELGVSHVYPTVWLARSEVLSGFFPLWNPMTGCGLPILANTLDETIMPWSVIKYLLPFPLGYNLYIAAKLMIALTGTFALARRLGAPRNGAILAAVIYGFTGFLMINVNNVIGTAFVLPWCLFSMHRLAMVPTIASAGLVALSFGLSLLGGNPQIPLQALIMGYGLYVLMLYCRRTPISLGKYVLLPAAPVAAGALLAMPQLLPFAEYLLQSFSHHVPGYGQLHLDPRGVIAVMAPFWSFGIFMMGATEFGGSIESFIATSFPPQTWTSTSAWSRCFFSFYPLSACAACPRKHRISRP